MKTLVLDIETSPAKAYIFQLKTNFIPAANIFQDVQVLCWVAKWLDDDEWIFSASLPDFSKWKKGDDLPSDKPVIQALIPLLEEADMVVAHNGKSFDMAIITARAIINGIPPLPPVKMVDTLLISRKIQKLLSHKLDFLGEVYNVGRKLEHEGMSLWVKCLDGDLSAWGRMLDYNKQDVYLLEDVYNRMLPYMIGHPNRSHGTVNDGEPVCRLCGGTDMQRRGFDYTNLGKYQRYQCQKDGCGKWAKGRTNLLTKEERASITQDIIT